MAKKDKKNEPVKPPEPSALERELAALDSTKRAALLMLVLGEQQASDIIGYLNRDEVETLGTAMVSVNDVSQTAVDKVLDQFIGELRGQTNLGLGSKDYVEGVLKRALGPEKIRLGVKPHIAVHVQQRLRDSGLDDATKYFRNDR